MAFKNMLDLICSKTFKIKKVKIRNVVINNSNYIYGIYICFSFLFVTNYHVWQIKTKHLLFHNFHVLGLGA